MFEISTPIFWVVMPIVVAVYYFGVFTGQAGMRQAAKREPFGHKHFYDCHDCVPGGSYRITADTKDHLAQMVQWHEDDHHPDIAEAQEDYGIEYVEAETRRFDWVRFTWWNFVGWYEDQWRIWKKRLTLPAWRTPGHQKEIDERRQNARAGLVGSDHWWSGMGVVALASRRKDREKAKAS